MTSSAAATTTTTSGPRPRTFQVESDGHLERDAAEYQTWDVGFPNQGDYLLLAGDCGATKAGRTRGWRKRVCGWRRRGLRFWDGSGDRGTWAGETNKAHNDRNAESLRWLNQEIARARTATPNDRIIIMTHHAPTLRGSGQIASEYKTGPISGSTFSGYHNDILGGEGIVELREGDHWVFGHTHYSCSFEQDQVRVTANQRGGKRNDSKLAETRYKMGGCTITV